MEHIDLIMSRLRQTASEIIFLVSKLKDNCLQKYQKNIIKFHIEKCWDKMNIFWSEIEVINTGD